MKKTILCCASMLAAWTVTAGPQDDINAAAAKLADQANYSWTATVTVPEDAPFHPGPTDGQTEKDGYTDIKMSFGDNKMEIVKKGAKAAFINQDGEWQTPEETQGFASGMVRNVMTPANQVTNVAAGIKEFKVDGDAISGDLTEDAVKKMMAFRRRGGTPPAVSDASGSAKFWLKDGQLAKYEFKVSGKMEFNGNEMNVERTTTVEIKDVGTTKVTVPDEAKKKIEEPAPAPASATTPAPAPAPANN